MTWKAYAVFSGATTVLATYLVGVPPAFTPDDGAVRSSGVEAASASRTDPREEPLDIEREAARLQARLRAQAAYREPSRNPFQFGAKPAPARPSAIERQPGGRDPLAAITSAAPAPELPFIVLSGMALDVVDGTTVRTAIFTTQAGVVLARAGEAVGAEYRVRAIDDESVELESLADGSVRRLTFTRR